MGIPKFYRWTSERYPCLSEKIKEYQIPEFDNLYLDMNGIIHNCSHPNDEDVHLRIPEKQIFKDIFHYIDFLFKMIKPCQVFFMAVDGVAPRAKMNQQRGRRFRSAKVAEDQEAEAIRKGELLPDEDRFDSNCITPGTEFMARLHEQLKYFVQVKVSTDPLWQRPGLTVYLSGHDVPGEGEHKIMDFIRHERSKPDYVPVRHCLYGLDADLVMLGLSSHELHFSLLREEVKFTRAKKTKSGIKKPPKQVPSASYDLSNVSIFRSQGPTEVTNSQGAEKTEVDINASIVRQGQTFADALDKPSEIIVIPQKIEIPSSNDQKKEEDEPVAPPPPDESGATGVYRAPLPEKTTFLLLHLSLMRDYIDFEFKELQEKLKDHPTIKYDIESLIDDWIMMNILVGNDFVPHLPHLHIVKGALPMLYNVYTEVLPTLDGYINESGILQLSRFEAFIRRLSQFDIEHFRETYDDMKYMESKTGKNIVLGEKMFEGFDFENDTFVEEPLESMSDELKALANRTEAELFGEENEDAAGEEKTCNQIFGNNDDYFQADDSPELRLEFHQHKRNYYIDKLHMEKITPEFLESFCKEYIRAIQWVLLYYYKGVSSWGWFYPYHYAPFCSDLTNFANFSIEFDKGTPFRPFEQLLAVLPAQSKKLLPQCYQWLMTDEKSPIVEFYPEKFEQDLNGKKQDWEAVVLIPFIDELRLLQVMVSQEDKLNAEEHHRNARGSMLVCRYSSEDTGPIKDFGDLFPSLDSSHVHVEKIDEVTYNPKTLPKGLHPKAQRDAIYQGFPTLKTKPIKTVIEKADIKVFEFVTREESMIISLEDIDDNEVDAMTLGRKFIGRSVWVNWPHLAMAFVTAILTPQGKLFHDVSGRLCWDQDLYGARAEKEFRLVAKGLTERHLKCKGIRLGDIQVVIYAKMMEGRKVRCRGSGEVYFETLWSKIQQPFPLKTSMYEEDITEVFYLDRTLASTYLDLFKVGDEVVYLGDKMFGNIGIVVGHKPEKKSVRVKFLAVPGADHEPNLSSCIEKHELRSHEYYSSHVAAGKCQISSYTLSRLTGTVYVSIEKETRAHQKMLAKKEALLKRLAADTSPSEESSSSEDEDFPALQPQMRKINVGLDLKFNKKNLEVRGYTSKRDGLWYYSGKAIQLVNDYVSRFSDFIDFLNRSEKGRDVFDASEIFPESPLERINEMVEWLENRGVRDLPRISTNTKLLDDEDIDSIWKYILSVKRSRKKGVVRSWDVRPNLLLKPGLDRGCIPPIPNSTYSILDRVVCIDRGAPVPVGRKGTIVGIQTPQASEPEQIEESFKSTGAATLMTLIVLSDPEADVFDHPDDFQMNKNTKALTGALASLLKIADGSDGASSLQAVETSESKLRPRLVRLYPYQVLNISEGPTALHESHRDFKELRNIKGLPMNGHSKHLLPKPIKNTYSMDGPGPQPAQVKILQRPRIPVDRPQKTEVTTYDSKAVHLSRQKAVVSGNDAIQETKKVGPPSKSAKDLNDPVNPLVLPWPPRPRTESSTSDPFSLAAFLQKEMNLPSSDTTPHVMQANTSQKNQKRQQSKKPKEPLATVGDSKSGKGEDIVGLLTKANAKFKENNKPPHPKKGQDHHIQTQQQQQTPRIKPPPPPTNWIKNTSKEFHPAHPPQLLQRYPHPHAPPPPQRQQPTFQFPAYQNFTWTAPMQTYYPPPPPPHQFGMHYQEFHPQHYGHAQDNFVPVQVIRNATSHRQKDHKLIAEVNSGQLEEPVGVVPALAFAQGPPAMPHMTSPAPECAQNVPQTNAFYSFAASMSNTEPAALPTSEITNSRKPRIAANFGDFQM